MRTPRNLADAKAVFREEKAKFSGSLLAVAGSRWLMAILATFAIAFGVRLLYAPDQLPAVGGLSLSTLGLPPLDFGVVGEQAQQAREAAERQGAQGVIGEFISEHQGLVPVFNAAGFGLTLLLLLGNMWIMTTRRRLTRG